VDTPASEKSYKGYELRAKPGYQFAQRRVVVDGRPCDKVDGIRWTIKADDGPPLILFVTEPILNPFPFCCLLMRHRPP
jgi:hypothetical protein